MSFPHKVFSLTAPPKAAGASPTRKMPVEPPVYRPQPVPRVLQRKAVSGQQQPRAVQPRQPVAPPIFRPAAKKIVQPKLATTRAPKLPVAPPVYRPQPTPAVLQKKDFPSVVSALGHQQRTMPHNRPAPAHQSSTVAPPRMGSARTSFAAGIAAAGGPLKKADASRMGARAGSFLGPAQAKMGNSKQASAGVKKSSSPFLHTSDRPSYPYAPARSIQRCCAVIQRMIVPLGDRQSLAQSASFDEQFEANIISSATASLDGTGLYGNVRRLHDRGVGAVLGGLGRNEELILVAHGGHDFNEEVIHVYGGLTPTALAKALVDNGLSANYVGEIYLNGCNSATEIEGSKSYAWQFQKALAARGRRVRVKGNRGASKVLDNGVTAVVGATDDARQASVQLSKITKRVKQVGKDFNSASIVSKRILNKELSDQQIEELGADLRQKNPTAESVLQELGQKLQGWKDELGKLLPQAEELSRQAFVTDNSQVTNLAKPSDPHQTAHQILNFLLLIGIVLVAIAVHRRYFSNS
jgi:hypothetical protein